MSQPLPFPHGNATHSNLRLRDAHDAHVLFQAVRQGHLPLIRKRLTGPEQQALHAGQVFVWADREGSLERWTDGHNWSPSRVRGPFLMYDEMPEDTEAFQRRKQQQKNGERRVKQPRKKRLPPLPGGLSKQTYSATLIQGGVEIQKWHLTAYFKDDSSNDLMTIDEDDLLRTIIVPESTFKSSMSRKSKGSTSRRRNSVSEVRSVTTQDDEDDLERHSPIDEHSQSPPHAGRGYPSPPLVPQGDMGSGGAAFDFSLSGAPLPWQSATHTMDNDSGGSGSSVGTVTSPQSHFFGGAQHQGGYFQQQPQQPPLNRGRPMHLEGIHTRFDVNPGLTFSTMSPSTTLDTGRSASLQTDWRSPFSANILGGPMDLQATTGMGVGDAAVVDRRASLMSSRSTSSHSTSASSKLLQGGNGGMSSSNSSSPASSWSQQSPYLNPVATPSNWPSFNTNSNSPLVPNCPPSSQQQARKVGGTLPAHITHHPEHVPSAVPPRRQTLPALYSTDLASYVASPTTTWSPNPNSANPSGSSNQYFSPSSTTSYNAYFPEKQGPELQHPHPVTASGVPGSWEASESNPTSSQYDFALGPVDLSSPSGSVLVQRQQQQQQQQYGEVFENALPATTAAPANDYWG